MFGYYNTKDHSSSPDPSFAANLFNNEHVTCSQEGADWKYTPLKYWPAQGHIDFYAYAPYDAHKVLTGSKIKFTVEDQNQIANQTDLLWANAENKTKDNLPSADKNKVKFQFAHALSRLGYSVKLKDASYESVATITLNKITLAGSKDLAQNAFYKEGTIDLATGNWSTASSEDPKYNDAKQNFVWFNKETSGEKLSYNKAFENSDNEYLFVIPQNFSKTEPNSDQLYVIVEYTIQYSGGTVQPKVSYKVCKQLTNNFEQSKAYKINLTIGLNPIEFNADVTAWGNAIDSNYGIDSWE